jgi:hypothetical protein
MDVVRCGESSNLRDICLRFTMPIHARNAKELEAQLATFGLQQPGRL